jgi:hypothetical protein
VQQYVENRACALVKSGKAANFNAPQTSWYFRHIQLKV